MDYVLRISGDFEKGECEKCPIYEAFQNYAFACFAIPENCPLEEVKQGEWKNDLDENRKLRSVWRKCSCCGSLNYSTKPNYCPNCGADMRGGKE